MKIVKGKFIILSAVVGLGSLFMGCASTGEQQEDEFVEVSQEGESDQSNLAIEDNAEELAEEEVYEAVDGGIGDVALPDEVASIPSYDTAVDSISEATSEEVGSTETEAADYTSPDSYAVESQPDITEEVNYTAPAASSSVDTSSSMDVSSDFFDYIVRRGDTVSGVAKRVYGTYTEWQKISDASGLSNPNLIFPGDKLKVPLINDKARQFKDSYAYGETSTTGESISFTVREGDTLSSIAAQEFGDSSYWSEIFRTNRGKISDPNKIVVGQVLTIVKNSAH
ncbi:MAG: LysM peptidoglycan-binding domain-containing protein [Bdellovibrionota bacterium]